MISRHSHPTVISAASSSVKSLKAIVVSLVLLPAMSLADDQRNVVDALIDGPHQDAHKGNFHMYFDGYTPDAVFLGTDKSERRTIEEF